MNEDYALKISPQERRDIECFIGIADTVLTQVASLYSPNGNGMAVIHNNGDYMDISSMKLGDRCLISSICI